MGGGGGGEVRWVGKVYLLFTAYCLQSQQLISKQEGAAVDTKLPLRGWQSIPSRCDGAVGLTNLSMSLVQGFWFLIKISFLLYKSFGVLFSITCIPADTTHKIWFLVDLWTPVNVFVAIMIHLSQDTTCHISHPLSINQWETSQWLLHKPKAEKHTSDTPSTCIRSLLFDPGLRLFRTISILSRARGSLPTPDHGTQQAELLLY